LNEFQQIVTAVALEKQQSETVWKELREPYNIRRICLGCFMQIAQQWTGTNAIVRSVLLITYLFIMHLIKF
jgi:hypothetical protein